VTRWCLVVEDESPLGEMICDNLSLEGYGVELVKNGLEASARIEKGGLDLVVLDIMLPGRDGFEVLRRMRDADDDTPVLILSARAADDDRIRGLELRADDYLTKPFNLRELLLRVAALMRRVRPPEAGADVLRFGDNTIDFRARTGTSWRGESVTLTDTEIKVLRVLAGRRGTTVLRKEVVDLVFGPLVPVTTRTLDNVVASLRKRFERDSNSPEHFHTVRGVGWRLD